MTAPSVDNYFYPIKPHFPSIRVVNETNKQTFAFYLLLWINTVSAITHLVILAPLQVIR